MTLINVGFSFLNRYGRMAIGKEVKRMAIRRVTIELLVARTPNGYSVRILGSPTQYKDGIDRSEAFKWLTDRGLRREAAEELLQQADIK